MSSTRMVGESGTITLRGHVDELTLLTAGGLIRRMLPAPQNQRFILECSEVTAFSAPALAALAALIKEVREHGSDVAIVNLSQRIRHSMTDCLLESMLPPTIAEPLRELNRMTRASARTTTAPRASVN